MINISPEQKEIVCRILSEFIPDRKVMVLGSRTTENFKEYSDLDLAVMGSDPVEFRTMTLMKDAFAESDLPFRVDVLQWCQTSKEFQETIEQQLEMIYQG